MKFTEIKKIITIIILALNYSFAQDLTVNNSSQSITNFTTQITGNVLDLDMNNEPLMGATVVIEGTTTGVQTDFDGHFNLEIDSGTYTLNFSYVGYKTIKKTVTITEGEHKEINVSMTPVTLNAVVIKTTRSKAKETALLLSQKKAAVIETQIGAQELSKKGIGNVAVAVTKISGISKQGSSGSIYVRGLGDRYNTTTLNELPIPSNDPSQKNIVLNLFSTDIVEFISVDKSFQSKNSGDFGGANINISSKDFKGKAYAEIEIATNGNTNSLESEGFYLQDGPTKFGFYNNDFPNNPTSTYNYDTSWNPSKETPIGQNFSIKGGKSFTIGTENKLNVFATASHDNNYNYTEGISLGGVSKSGVASKNLTFKKYKHNTNSTFLTNIGFKIKNKHKLNYNFLLINSTSQDHKEFEGFIADIAEDNKGFIRRSNYDKTLVVINQLLGKSTINNRFKLNWGISYNSVFNDTPDRMVNTLRPDITNPEQLVVDDMGAISDNHRFFQKLKENEMAGRFVLNYKIAKTEDEDYKGLITFGGGLQYKTVDFEATQFNFEIDNPIIVTPHNLDSFFNEQNFINGYFKIKTFRYGQAQPLKPATYNGVQQINYGFTNVVYDFNDKLTTVFGVRAEQIKQNIEWDTQLSTSENKADAIEILPSASLKYALNEKQNLRLSTSKTYTLPQFKERAKFQFENVTTIEVGNPNLYASTNYNLDLKWEMFPKRTELVSVTTFGKYIKNPINKIVIASSTNDISYVNTGDFAHVLGAELEVKKDLFNFKGDLDHKLSGAFNASYIYSNQEFSNDKIQKETDYSATFTHTEGALTGASPVLINTDISYFKEFTDHKNIQATLSYSYFSDRDFAIGTNFIGNTVEKSVSTLNILMKYQANKNIKFGLSVKNITNPMIQQTQENENNTAVVNAYKRGLDVNLKIAYKF